MTGRVVIVRALLHFLLITPALVSCSGDELEPIDPGPPPALTGPAPAQEQYVQPREKGAQPPRIIPVRYGVAIFVAPRESESKAPEYSPEWTAKALNQLDYNKVPVTAVEAKEPLSKGLEAGLGALVNSSTANSSVAGKVDVLLGGVLEPGSITRVRMVALDTEKNRVAGRSGFEGSSASAALDRTLEEILGQIHTYWVDLERGENSELQIVVQGLKSEVDIPQLHAAISRLPGVKSVRHEQTAVKAGTAVVVFHTFFEGASGVLTAQVGQISWPSRDGPARLEPAPQGGGYRVRYE